MSASAMIDGRSMLGSQIWLEPDDSDARIDLLCSQAADAGLGWLRITFIWAWIEPTPGARDWRIFDAVFESAARHGLRVKATLTANTPPWHVGAPSLLHSFTVFLSETARDAAAGYIAACVQRYKDHPALGQWILWNEPDGMRIGDHKPDAALSFWRDMLAADFGNDIASLNRRWRTGYATFDQIPFADDVLHPAYLPWTNWASYGPRLKEWQFKARYLNQDLRWVADQVRALDDSHDFCANPTTIHFNGAEGATDATEMAALVDVLGASYHPAWAFGFAEREDFAALMNTGLRLQAARSGVTRVEVTEVQSGNTLKSSNRPSDAEPDEVVRFHLAALAAGAESVTGWCLNARSHDFEAGDWALLDDMDEASDRSRAMRRLSERLTSIHRITGAWRRAVATAFVVSDPRAHALEWIESKVAYTKVAGRMSHDGAHGAALLSTMVAGFGLPVDIVTWDGLPEDGGGKLAVVSHVVAIDPAAASRLERFVASGGDVMIDATSGHKDFDAALYRPWPGGVAETFSIRVVGMESRADGWPVRHGAGPPVTMIAARSRLVGDRDAGWRAVPGFRFATDGEPLVLRRDYMKGSVSICRGLMGPTLVHNPLAAPLISELLRVLADVSAIDIAPAAHEKGLWCTPIETSAGHITLVLAPSLRTRAGRPVVMHARAGRYVDLWGENEVEADFGGELTLTMPDGIALLRPVT